MLVKFAVTNYRGFADRIEWDLSTPPVMSSIKCHKGRNNKEWYNIWPERFGQNKFQLGFI